ncbi:hypothetical protein ASD15_30385 [Massilia sp. Root351]|jgi:hypothetical protein|uniref:hypothetical protein n=1 Tax=Massilia sp. Root351 TaxID=1736522 RepID=UPI00070EEF8C|nr:hypothetical protein [Massilia sp. Root351]KQV85345.1 hypothetical protein ASD15_30385 [Massilia sp. Root351]
MDYLLPFEREALARGEQEGLERGIRQGQALVLERLLAHRFGILPDYVKQRLQDADTAPLTVWTDRLLYSATLSDLFGSQQTA